MPLKFEPNFTLTSKTTKLLLEIEATKERVLHLPTNSIVLASLRETARLYTAHYSTMIEGNKLEPDQIKVVLEHKGHFPGRERDEGEVLGYYSALDQVEKWVARGIIVSEKIIQTLHALVLSEGRTSVKPTPYRDGQNVIKDGRTKSIVYMPPEAKDVQSLMSAMVLWINDNPQDLPCPIVAAVAHYQFATIHPYYDGNGRTARLLTNLILHLGNYDLKGLYSLEEYYAKNLGLYYQAISVGPSHNYYLGRAEADITQWIEFFLEGMANSFKSVAAQMQNAQDRGLFDNTDSLRKLDPKQRKALELFQNHEFVTNSQIGQFFGFKARTSANLCAKWVQSGFLKIIDPSKKARKYSIGDVYKNLVN